MNRRRAWYLALAAVAFIPVFVAPVAAQGGYDSVTEELIRGLNSELMWVAIPITVLVEGILIYTVWKFRNNDDPKPTKENRRLEITWTVATAIVLLFVGVASYQVLGNPFVAADSTQQIDSEQEPLNVTVEAFRYNWQFNYEDANVSTGDALVLPSDRPVRLQITSRDWLHAFHVPALGLKQDAFPNKTNTIMTQINPSAEGNTYMLYCAEYCGSGHSQMLSTVEVKSQGEFETWLDEQQSE
jgi:cytochrome c oxidase subunit 2